MTLTTDHPTLQEEENVILIAVMGLTGSGKSTFVKLATGSDEVIVGTELTSCMICDFHCGFSLLNHQGTKKPTLHAFDLSGVKIVLIDTPGFDDTYLSNGDVLQEIAECLKLTYECNMKLTGIIYLHRIMDPRMTQGGMRNLSMFRKLCGSDPMKNVILATTFWGKVTESEGLAREVELQTNPDFWAEMIEEGAQVARLDHTQESTLDLIRRLIKRGKVDLQIQTELCERELPLTQTQAGEQVNRDLADMAKKHAEEIQNLQKEMQDAIKDADKKWELALQKELAKNELKLAKLHEQQAALRDDHRNETRILEQEMDRRWRRELKKMVGDHCCLRMRNRTV